MPFNPFERPLILIGYWSGGYGNDNWPDVRDFVDENWHEDERLDVGHYVGNGLVARAWMGFSPCRLCDRTTNGNLDLTDGTYIWPEGLAHYVLDHSVRLPQTFVDHVLAQAALTEDVTVDDSWWRGLARD